MFKAVEVDVSVYLPPKPLTVGRVNVDGTRDRRRRRPRTESWDPRHSLEHGRVRERPGALGRRGSLTAYAHALRARQRKRARAIGEALT